jgi:branched-chain amino acid transport system permease protein
MGFFLEVLIGGLLTGVLYSLVALGFVLIFKASGVFNFAQGAMVLMAGLALVQLIQPTYIGLWHFVGIGTIAPWAKLNTPDALKISTNPSATSE